MATAARKLDGQAQAYQPPYVAASQPFRSLQRAVAIAAQLEPKAFSEVKTRLDDQPLPTDAVELLAKFVATPLSAEQLQKRMCHQQQRTLFARLLAKMSPADQARLRSAAGPGASRAFTVRPDDDTTRLSSVEMRMATSARLGLHYFSGARGAKMCPCGKAYQDQSHPSTCSKLRRTANLQTLHDVLKRLLCQLAARCGVPSQMEYPLPSGDLMDVVLALPDRTLHVDISTTCPSAATYARGASKVGLFAAVAREAHKDKAYRAQVEREGGICAPVITETYGAMPKSVPRLFELLAQTGKELHVPGAPSKNGMMNIWAVAVQRGFALLHIRAMSGARQPLSAVK